MLRLALMLLASMTIVSCAQQQPLVVQVAIPLDEDQAGMALAQGNNEIKGSALVRQNGGGVVSCAGRSVILVAATDYAKARIFHLYKSTASGYRPVHAGRILFDPDLPAYRAGMRDTVCDAQGYFKFDRVADGNYFVNTQITWVVGSSPQGGTLMKQVAVRGGEKKEIVLAP
jgi:hypothetical protein